ncbi:MAG: PolC-type DNA polymerase III [Christensenellales bacterium]
MLEGRGLKLDLPGVAPEVFEAVRDIAAFVDERRQEIRIRLCCERLLSKEERLALRRGFADFFGKDTKISLELSCADLQGELRQRFGEYQGYLEAMLTEKFPGSASLLAGANWCYGEDGLEIQLAIPGGDSLFSVEWSAYLEQLLHQTFAVQAKVCVSSEPCGLQPRETEDVRKRQALKKLASRPKAGGEGRAKGAAAGGGRVVYGKPINQKPVSMLELGDESGRVTVCGEILKISHRVLRGNEKMILLFDMSGGDSSLSAKLFAPVDNLRRYMDVLTPGARIVARGDYEYDNFAKENVLMVRDITLLPKERIVDEAPMKRVELHLHTRMSALDALTNVDELFAVAKAMGHRAVAITDHGVVQAFPDAYSAAKKNGVRALFGMEGYLVADSSALELDKTDFVVFDIETTGLKPNAEKIIEIGAVRLRQGEIVDEFSRLINPQKPISDFIAKLTGIGDAMVQDAPLISEVLPKFLEFCGDACLVAHNAAFDVGFIGYAARQMGLSCRNPVADTLELSRMLFPEQRSHKLSVMAGKLGIDMGSHHRAADDARTTAQIFVHLTDLLKKRGQDVLWVRQADAVGGGKARLNHIILLAKNQAGLQNLYRLVSKSHLENYYYKPRLNRDMIMQHREGLLLGSACEQGELYQAILSGAEEKQLLSIADFYDYLEIQPLGNNEFLLRRADVSSREELMDINRRIVDLGKKLNKPVVATGDVHFLKPRDEYFRRILMAGQGFEDADQQAPLFYRTTGEMLEEFAYLGEQTALEVVVENPNAIAEQMEDLMPFPDGTYPPQIEGAKEEVRSMSVRRAHELYGKDLPAVVAKRLDKELNSIINHGFAVLYFIAYKLVKKSLDDGYLVGSRGSVGSSFVAYLMGITEVNPLEPHYVCPACAYSDFGVDAKCGVDLPDKVCPVCAHTLSKTGYDIPFEVFLGFKGDKVPDIDLNFSGEYQSVAHKYTEELFGEGYVFRAGTTASIKAKTAYGFVMKYLEARGLALPKAEIERLSQGCSGVKRTTGQHPGGVIVLPKDRDIHEFTPLQHPADDKESGVVTTHFDFNSLHDRLIKLDILGHDDPTSLKMLEDITGVDPRGIPLDDPLTMSIFSGTEALGVSPREIDCEVGTLGIPEFGTSFVRQMLMDTRPKTMAELIRISGLSHGTDVWLNNAQDLIRNKVATLSEVICTRDDIMNYLISRGMDSLLSFKTMEDVRKGKGLTEEMKQAMQACGVPQWFMDSCEKIQYMFPKAHAAAYVMMAFRIAYFKVHHKEAYYATYFSVRAADFDSSTMIVDNGAIAARIQEIEKLGTQAGNKEKSVLSILEIVYEMNARGVKFLPVDLYQSHASRFMIEEDGIRAPLCSLPGLGKAAAEKMVEAREQAAFISQEDLKSRGKVSKTVVELLDQCGCLESLPKTSQLSLF